MQTPEDQARDFFAEFSWYQPASKSSPLSVAAADLDNAYVLRTAAELRIVQCVAAARGAGMTWEKIGAHLGVSKQAAARMYGPMPEIQAAQRLWL